MFSRFDTVPACDGQTDGQTDGRTDGRPAYMNYAKTNYVKTNYVKKQISNVEKPLVFPPLCRPLDVRLVHSIISRWRGCLTCSTELRGLLELDLVVCD